MANTFFQFKQFKVNQENCGMKVTTDACLFGAWVVQYMSNNQIGINNHFNILDIGTGTGVLALMLAQINQNIRIEGVEIDPAAAQQATENCKTSPFNNQIKVYNNDIKDFEASITNGYNFIITNPPFFNDDLKSPSHNRNLAMHSLAMSLEELAFEIKRLLVKGGSFAILLPYHRTDFFIGIAALQGFKLLESLFVKQTTKHPYFRSILLFVKADFLEDDNYKKSLLIENELVIKEGNDYSFQFKELLKPYYLKL